MTGSHTRFNQTEARTGRLSSDNPNLQNIPIRTELGSQLRAYFIAKPGWVLVDADYSQIELRILAHVTGDEHMQHAFLSGEGHPPQLHGGPDLQSAAGSGLAPHPFLGQGHQLPASCTARVPTAFPRTSVSR